MAENGSSFSWLNLIPGIGSGIANWFQGEADRKLSRENTDKTIAANRAMAEYQYSKDIEMWERGNVYNSPSAQMDRLRSAGLNPNLVYGTGAVGNSGGQLPKFNAPSTQYNYRPGQLGASVAQGLGSFQDFELKKAQIDSVKAQIDATRQNTLNSAVQGRILELDEFGRPYKNAILGSQAMAARGLAESQLSIKQAEARRGVLSNERLLQDILFAKYRNEWAKEGVTSGDNVFLRMMAKPGSSLRGLGKQASDWMRKTFGN